MGLMAKDKGGGDIKPIPQDLHIAVCYGVWDIGTSRDERWGKSIHKVIIVWELPKVRAEFERDGIKKNLPRAISKKYRLSLHEKADLRKDLQSWRGKQFTPDELKGFDLKNLIGAPCQIQVIHNEKGGKTFSNIAAITKASAGTKIVPENPVKFFSFEEGGPIPEGTPDWIMDLIKQSDEYKREPGSHEEEDQNDIPPIEDEEIPF